MTRKQRKRKWEVPAGACVQVGTPPLTEILLNPPLSPKGLAKLGQVATRICKAGSSLNPCGPALRSSIVSDLSKRRCRNAQDTLCGGHNVPLLEVSGTSSRKCAARNRMRTSSALERFGLWRAPCFLG